MRTAFLGFAHFHVQEAYRLVRGRPEFQIVAACEEDPLVRSRLPADIEITHVSGDELLGSGCCQLLVIGDVFARRSGWALRALRAGLHVLSDKPICTRLEDLDRLAAQPGVLWAMLELRDRGILIRARELIRAGEIGEVLAVEFAGQHPLLAGERPAWYWKRDLHGGTINDLAVHAVDALAWITGRGVVDIPAARSWRAGRACPAGLRNAAQLMLVLEGGAGVIGDVSYVAPDSFRYGLPQYWRFTFWGERGLIEAPINASRLLLCRQGDDHPLEVAPSPDRRGGYLDDVLAAVGSGAIADELRRGLLAATRTCLLAQQAADRGSPGS
jgi:predicted dehydrogenase